MKAFGIVIVILAAVLAVMGVFGSITDITNRTLTFYSVAISAPRSSNQKFRRS